MPSDAAEQDGALIPRASDIAILLQMWSVRGRSRSTSTTKAVAVLSPNG